MHMRREEMKARRMKGKQRCMLIAVMGCLLLTYASLWRQPNTASSLQRTIADNTQAMLAKAEVTITNKESGARRAAKTTDTGEYRFEVLAAGIYNVKVTAAGFASAEAKNVEVLIGRTASQNFSLKPSTVTEAV